MQIFFSHRGLAVSVLSQQARTPLEQEIFGLLHKTKQPVTDPLLTPEETASLQAMSLEEVSASLPMLCPGSGGLFLSACPHSVLPGRPGSGGQSCRRLGSCSPTMKPRLGERRRSRARSKALPLLSSERGVRAGSWLWCWSQPCPVCGYGQRWRKAEWALPSRDLQCIGLPPAQNSTVFPNASPAPLSLIPWPSALVLQVPSRAEEKQETQGLEGV